MIPTLTTDRLILRVPQLGDTAASVAFILSDRARLMVDAMTEDEARAEFAAVIDHWAMRGFGLFAITLKGSATAIGLAGPWMPQTHPEPEIGWNLWDGAYEGKGIATEATRAARTWAFAAQGWETAVSYIHPDNTASIRLATRIGAVPDPDASCPYPPPFLIYRHHAGAVAA